MKLNVPLNKQGVEMRLPAIPMIKPSWRLLSGSLSIILIALIAYFFTSPEFSVKTPIFKGLNRMKSADFDGALVLNNSRIFMIDPFQVEKLLRSSFPELKDVNVEVGFPAKVTISVVERQPVVTWKYQDMNMWIDNEGILFPSHGNAETVLTISSDGAPPMVQPLFKPDLLVDGIEDKKQEPDPSKKADPKPVQMFVDRNVLNAAILLYQQMPANTTVLYDKNHGLGWVDDQGWNVYVGFELNQLDEKMLVYQKLVERLQLMGLHPKMISVEYVSAPYYRLE